MACQSLHLGPAWIWKKADDATTVLFTVELLVRIFEKGLPKGEPADEVRKRQEEWEKEIESLDQNKMEVHQSQLRLIREQVATFIRDLAVLQGQVSALFLLKDNLSTNLSSSLAPLQNDVKEQKAKLMAQEQLVASTQKRMDYLEQMLGDSVERHTQDLESAKLAHSRLADETKAREAHHASVAERLNYIEQLVGDSFEKHSKEIQGLKDSSHSRLETMHSRLSAFETEATKNSLRERVDYLEKLLGDSLEKHSQGIQVAHGNLQEQMFKLHGSLHERLDRLENKTASPVAFEELLAQEQAERSKHHSSVEGRMESVQKTLDIFDSLLRKEIEERGKDYQRLWDAIDTHTHDLSTQVIGEAVGGYEVTVVAISLFSMVITQQAAATANGQAPNGAAMQKMKVLRTLRLLRLLRLFRVFKGVEEVNRFVELLLNSVRTVFLSLIVVLAGATLLLTVIIACGATAKAWLREHSLPKLPEIH
eukprot:Skav209751  [mRNA]  locus=scaffold9:81946:101178:+ [translate_table: standard]